jgi:hypothetical protein
MASKTVWIVGGLVVAIGVVAYVAFKPAPATDASGTIVEAKRARADGTNSFNPSPTASTTDQNASDASKAMAGPDAAKDAAAAAGSADNGLNLGGTRSGAHPAEAADAAAAASGSSENLRGISVKGGAHPAAAQDAADAAAAKSRASNLRGVSAAGHEAAAREQAGMEKN